jgi:hypothetical protein
LPLNVVDELPDLDGIHQFYGRSVFTAQLRRQAHRVVPMADDGNSASGARLALTLSI